MNFKKYIVDFAIIFSVTLLVSIIVTFFYSLVVHKSGIVDWETSFRFAIILGIVFSWIRRRDKK